MAEQVNLKEVMERGIAALREDPSRGRGTATTTITIRSGVTCDVTDGGWTLVGDEGVGDGGAGLGPDPGVFVRAGLGTCLAMGYVQSAALLDVPIDSVHVTIEADYDASGMMGIDESVPPGWGAVRYSTAISSPAPEEKVREVVEYADRRSSVLDIIQRAVPVTGTHEITSGGGG